MTARRLKCCGMEDRTVVLVAHGSSKTKNLIYCIDGNNVVAYGRLPYPALPRLNKSSALVIIVI